MQVRRSKYDVLNWVLCAKPNVRSQKWEAISAEPPLNQKAYPPVNAGSAFEAKRLHLSEAFFAQSGHRLFVMRECKVTQ